MKRYWTVALLVLLMAAVLCGCGGKKQEEAVEEPPQQPQVQEDPDTLVCCNGTTTLRFRKEEAKWVWFDDTSFPLDQAYVQDILDMLQGLRELTPVAPRKALSEYGLEGAKAYVMLKDTSGNESYVYLGKAADNGYYIYDGTEEGSVYVAPTALMEQVSRSIYDLAVLPTMPQLTPENITALDVTVDDKAQHLTVKDGLWYAEGADVTEKMAAVTDTLSRLELASCVDYRPANGAADICGLTKNAVVLTVSYDTDATFTLTIGAPRGNSGYYALINDDTTIYLLPTDLAQPLKALAEDGV